MNLNFSEPMSENFTKKHQDIYFSDALKKSPLQKLLIILDFRPPNQATLNGEWRW